MTVAKAGDSNNVLSAPSGQVKVAPAAPVLKEVSPVDASTVTVDNSAGSSLIVNFSAPADTTNIDSYTVVAVLVGQNEPRTVADVEALTNGKVAARPSGNGFSAPVSQDTQGNAIDTTTKAYKIFIVSNAKSGSAISVVREMKTSEIKAVVVEQPKDNGTSGTTSEPKESAQ
ncbi:hypothetical protein D3C75_1046930 [compost metagenome]